jgi:penicillin-binding protein 1C
MSTSSESNNTNGNSNHYFLHLFMQIPWTFIYIGDGVRLGIRMIWVLLSKAYNILIRGIPLPLVTFPSFIQSVTHLPKSIRLKLKIIYIRYTFFLHAKHFRYHNNKNLHAQKNDTHVNGYSYININKVQQIPQKYDRTRTLYHPHLSLREIVEQIRTRFDLFAAREAIKIEKTRETKRMRLIKVLTKKQMRTTIKILKHPFVMFLTGITFSCLFLLIPFASYLMLQSLPDPHLLSERNLDVSTQIFDRNGLLLYEIYADENRNPIKLTEIPDMVKEATIAIEDREFYRHNGVSVKGILRSLKEILFDKTIQGGSTITQQLIKTAILTPDVSLKRKLKEIILAFWAERIYSKDQILEMYLNQVPYGGTAWGVEAAAETFFGKPINKLTLGEISLLAGLPAAPSDYSPYGAHPEKAVIRQMEVLRRMVEDRYITQKAMQAALSEKIQFIPQRTGIKAPHFVMYIKNQLVQKYGARKVERGGLRITTSLDLPLQEKAEEIVQKHIESLAALSVGNGAALITNPKTGEILAMIGSKNYFDTTHDGNVNITTSLRQPGSSIKVVTYATAIESKTLTAASIIQDTPTVFPNPGSIPYAPVNYDGRFHGPVPLRLALGNSYNIPAVKTLQIVGMSKMIDTAKAMGITSWDDDSRFGLSLTLGGGEVTMIDMSEVYGTLANSGIRVDTLPVLSVVDYTGEQIEINQSGAYHNAISKETSFIMSDILADNFARSNAFGSNSTLVIPDKTVSVKTGTSNDKRDNWTIGYTSSVVVTVWVGNNDNSPMNPTLTSGITGASPIWHDLMVEILKNKNDEKIEKPDGVIAIPCYFGKSEYFISGTEPKSGSCGPLPTAIPSRIPTPTQ